MTQPPLNIVVLISGSGTNLQAIIDGQQSNQLHTNIKAVISNKPQAYGLERAHMAGLNYHCIDSSSFTHRSDYDQALMDYISQYKPDLIILAGFMRILGPAFVQQFNHRIINIHPSLLPNYPGLHTHDSAIGDQVTEHGCSVHFVTNELDAGPLIAQAIVTVKRNDTAETLRSKVQTAEHFLYPTVINWFAQKRISIKAEQIFFDGIPLPNGGFKFKVNEYL